MVYSPSRASVQRAIMARCLHGQRFSSFLSKASAGRAWLSLLYPSSYGKPFLSSSNGRRSLKFLGQTKAQQSTAVLNDRQAIREVSGTQGGSAVESASVTFQDAVVRLQEYWSSVGCTLWQPHNAEVCFAILASGRVACTLTCRAEPDAWRAGGSRYHEPCHLLEGHRPRRMESVLHRAIGSPG